MLKRKSTISIYPLISVVVFVLSIQMFSILGCSNKKEGTGLVIDFNTQTYSRYKESIDQPQNFKDEIINKYQGFNPSVIQAINLYSNEGLRPALLFLYDRLAHSEDPVELLEIRNGLLYTGTYLFSVLLNDPQTIIDTFGSNDYQQGDEEERAAADYLVALAYARGDFEMAVINDQERDEIGLNDDKYNALLSERIAPIREKGIDDLKAVSEEYPNTKIGLLARSDYIHEQAYINRKFELQPCLEGLQIAIEYYPDSAFMADAYISQGACYLNTNRIDLARESYEEVLNLPDYRSARQGYTIHQSVEETIQDIDKKLY